MDGAHGVRDNVKRAGEIVRRLRAVTKRGAPERAPFDLRDLVRETLDLVRVGRCSGVSLVDRSLADVTLDADRVQIQQVIVNLLKNGCEAASVGAGGRVTISTAIDLDHAIVSVRDNGKGGCRQCRIALRLVRFDQA